MNIKIPSQKRVLDHYGEDIQSMIHAEECGELIQAISKMRRAAAGLKDRDTAYNNLVEEMADVLICMEQMKEMYEIWDSEIQGVVDSKCRRQERRMDESR